MMGATVYTIRRERKFHRFRNTTTSIDGLLAQTIRNIKLALTVEEAHDTIHTRVLCSNLGLQPNWKHEVKY